MNDIIHPEVDIKTDEKIPLNPLEPTPEYDPKKDLERPAKPITLPLKEVPVVPGTPLND